MVSCLLHSKDCCSVMPCFVFTESWYDGNGSAYLSSSANDGPAADDDGANGNETTDGCNQSATAFRSVWKSVIVETIMTY